MSSRGSFGSWRTRSSWLSCTPSGKMQLVSPALFLVWASIGFVLPSFGDSGGYLSLLPRIPREEPEVRPLQGDHPQPPPSQ